MFFFFLFLFVIIYHAHTATTTIFGNALLHISDVNRKIHFERCACVWLSGFSDITTGKKSKQFLGIHWCHFSITWISNWIIVEIVYIFWTQNVSINFLIIILLKYCSKHEIIAHLPFFSQSTQQIDTQFCLNMFKRETKTLTEKNTVRSYSRNI